MSTQITQKGVPLKIDLTISSPIAQFVFTLYTVKQSVENQYAEATRRRNKYNAQTTTKILNNRECISEAE